MQQYEYDKVETARESELKEAMADLEDATVSLADAIEHLAPQLTMYMRPQPPQPVGDQKEKAQVVPRSAPIVEKLGSMRRTIEVLRERVEDLSRRVVS